MQRDQDMDGDGDGSRSSDVSSTADDEGPRWDPELTQPNVSPPTDLYFTEEEDALYRLYVRTRRRRRTRRTRVQLDPNMEADDDEYGSFILDAVPASSVAIACLPETTVGVGEGERRERGACGVCLDEYEAGDALRTMPCAHGFHERCIVEWLRASRLCPLCRFPLPAEEDTETDDEEDEREAGHDDGEKGHWST